MHLTARISPLRQLIRSQDGALPAPHDPHELSSAFSLHEREILKKKKERNTKSPKMTQLHPNQPTPTASTELILVNSHDNYGYQVEGVCN
jgi:hypothetical protein